MGKKALRIVLVLYLLVAISAGVAGAAAPSPIVEVELGGMVDAITSRHVVRAIDAAERDGRSLVVIRMDTPGGLDGAMREIIRKVLNSRVPIAVFVAPEGSRAASAGLFIAQAAHIAAMAPNTNLGAAHPVALGSGPQASDPVLESKATNDAAAYIRGIAESRGRNAEWVERAVRESISATSIEALQLGVIDLVAADTADLLARLDGRVVETAAGPLTLRTAGVRPDFIGMSAIETFLHIVVDPNIAFLLFSLGGIAMIAELYNPGLIFPGVAGAIALILAFVAFGSLPVNWAGVALIGLALACFALEAFVTSHGVLGGGGVVALVLGALFLFQPPAIAGPAVPQIQVSRIVIGVTGTLAAAFVVLMLRVGLTVRRARPVMRPMPFVNAVGVAKSAIGPVGTVLIDSEEWSAEAQAGQIREGQAVRVIGTRGLTLLVESPTGVEAKPTDAGAQSSNPEGPGAAARSA